MLLGTLLGDASLEWTTAYRYPRYRASHGLPQKDYCWAKYRLLWEFCNQDPKDIPNGGYGTTTVRFETRTTERFFWLGSLCLRPHPTKAHRRKKVVTQEWVDLLTWEAVAWWFMDDGCKQSTGLMISTHSFSKAEVDLLADWLTNHGCPAHAAKTRKGETKEYWILQIPTESAAIFKKRVSPYILPMMRYKLEGVGPAGRVYNCLFCGEPYQNLRLTNPEIPCCLKPECKRVRNRQRGAKWVTRLGSAEVYRRAREALTKDPEKKAAAHAKALQRQREAFEDPVYRTKMNAWKKEYRLKLKAEGRPDQAPRLSLTCQFCAAMFVNSKAHTVKPSWPVIYCPAPECLEKKEKAMRRIRQDRQNAKRAVG